MYELSEGEGIAYLVEMGANCIPITLSSLLNTFKDAKYDYESDINNRIYCGINDGTSGKRSYAIALYMYNCEEYNYVAHFIDINDPWNEHKSNNNDELLLIRLFLNDHREDKETDYIFVNKYYYDDNYNEYDISINKKGHKIDTEDFK